MAIYVCKIKNSDEIIWKLEATCIENARIKFAQIKHLDLSEYNRLFDTEELYD
tara:strand:+ start:2905 stop:3063 length:159 start_codon:yes stop_codon:yes gene_type:complete